jgi:hypothetical protein
MCGLAVKTHRCLPRLRILELYSGEGSLGGGVSGGGGGGGGGGAPSGVGRSADGPTVPTTAWRPPVALPYPLLGEFGGVGGQLLQLSQHWDAWNRGSACLLEDVRMLMTELL